MENAMNIKEEVRRDIAVLAATATMYKVDNLTKTYDLGRGVKFILEVENRGIEEPCYIVSGTLNILDEKVGEGIEIKNGYADVDWLLEEIEASMRDWYGEAVGGSLEEMEDEAERGEIPEEEYKKYKAYAEGYMELAEYVKDTLDLGYVDWSE